MTGMEFTLAILDIVAWPVCILICALFVFRGLK